jgi:hypothetical protein
MGMIKRIIGLVLVSVLLLSACMSTHYLTPQEESVYLTRRTIYVVLDDGTEVKLKRCVLQEDLLIGFARTNERVEVERSRIRATYYKKVKPVMPYLAVCSAGAAGIAIWLIVSAFTAPNPTW